MRLMRRWFPLLVLAAAIVPAGTAHAGGWATVELDAMPAGLSAGEPWRMQMLVKAHGLTPVDGLQPSVRISNGDGVVRTFRTRPAGRPGWYTATVTYPSVGVWQTRLFDGYTNATPHRLAPLQVAAAGGGGATGDAGNGAGTAVADRTAPATGDGAAAGDGFPWPQAIAIMFVAALWIAGWVATAGPRRGRRAALPGRYLPAE
jgi:hypothetical protein